MMTKGGQKSQKIDDVFYERPKAYLGRSPMDKKELNCALLEGARKHGDQITNFD